MTQDELTKLLNKFLCSRRMDGLAALERMTEQQGGGSPLHQYLVRRLGRVVAIKAGVRRNGRH